METEWVYKPAIIQACDEKVVWIILCDSYRFSVAKSENKLLFCLSPHIFITKQ